ncbi:MAG: hypothetical protein HON47_00120, partial [Candidatus Diapherotrites archaeon]|nr:hypothetical protein [Candidatus Diapherotrites archaeon]
KKVSIENSGVVCENCGEVKGEKRAIMGIVVEDDTGEVRANLFGDSAIKAIGMDKTNFEKELDEKSSEKLVEEIREKISGNELKLFGYLKVNNYSGENEFSVKDVI